MISTEPDKAKAFEAQRGKLPLEKIKSIIINLSEEKETPLAIFYFYFFDHYKEHKISVT